MRTRFATPRLSSDSIRSYVQITPSSVTLTLYDLGHVSLRSAGPFYAHI